MVAAIPGCTMCHSLYVKANGEMPCWDDVGEAMILRTLDEGALLDDRESPVFYGAELQHIRQSFIDGKQPFPDFCSLCAVRGQGGTVTALRPRTMEVLHLEASYLCHLSCPQCIPAKARRDLKSPPFNMTPRLLEGLLRELRSEGIDAIRFIHFEGRGDPLVNPALPQLIESSRRFYPRSIIGATTHGSYRYMPWIVRSSLDLLRVSIDGATPHSYEKYRAGGRFEQVIDFLSQLRDDRNRLGTSLRVEWKYILFEWNDSDDEMSRAVDLARQLQVRLTFVRTHTPGRSQRFLSDEQLQEYVRRFADDAACCRTFQLRTPGGATAPDSVTAEHVTALLRQALAELHAGRDPDAKARVLEALRHDPDAIVSGAEDTRSVIRMALAQILEKARFPATLTYMAAISRQLGDGSVSDQLLDRYLQLVPDAPDRNHIIADRTVGSAIEHAYSDQLDLANTELRRAISLETGIPEETVAVKDALNATHTPYLIWGAAHVTLAEGKLSDARESFMKYREATPAGGDASHVSEIISDIERQLSRRPRTVWSRALGRIRRYWHSAA